MGENALRNFAERIGARFPGVRVRFAFTSGHMRSRLAAAGKKTDSVKKALCRMGYERYTHVAVQSLHLIPGREYEALLEDVQEAGKTDGPKHIAVGEPLLHNAEDIGLAAEALLAHLPPERAADDAVICVGHGTRHNGAASYEALARAVKVFDRLIFIGTLAGAHGMETLLPAVRSTGARTVWLLPLLAIVGKHAQQDMAGESPASWYSRITQTGIVCKPVLKGTVEYAGFAKIWLMHLARAMDALLTAQPAATDWENA